MKIKTKKTYGAWFGLILGLIVFSFCIWGVNFALADGDKVLKLIIEIPIYFFLVLFIIILIGAFNMHYFYDETGFRIHWGFYSVFIPWEKVKAVTKIEGASNIFPILGVSWPGLIVGLYQVKGLGTAKIFGTDTSEGFIYLKSDVGYFALTPEDDSLYELIAEKSNTEVEVFDMDDLSVEEKGKGLMEDRFYSLLFKLNIIFLAIFALYTAIFFPGSGAPNFIILLLVLAVGIFFFNISNAARLYQFSDTGGCVLLVLGLAVTGIFIILSLSEITL